MTSNVSLNTLNSSKISILSNNENSIEEIDESDNSSLYESDDDNSDAISLETRSIIQTGRRPMTIAQKILKLVERKENSIEKAIKRDEDKSLKRLEKRLNIILGNANIAEIQQDIFSNRLTDEQLKRNEDIDKNQSEHFQRIENQKYKRNIYKKTIPGWFKELQDVRELVYNFGHSNKSNWRSKILVKLENVMDCLNKEISNQLAKQSNVSSDLYHTQSSLQTYIDCRTLIEKVSFNINTLTANELVNKIEHIKDVYMKQKMNQYDESLHSASMNSSKWSSILQDNDVALRYKSLLSTSTLSTNFSDIRRIKSNINKNKSRTQKGKKNESTLQVLLQPLSYDGNSRIRPESPVNLKLFKSVPPIEETIDTAIPSYVTEYEKETILKNDRIDSMPQVVSILRRASVHGDFNFCWDIYVAKFHIPQPAIRPSYCAQLYHNRALKAINKNDDTATKEQFKINSPRMMKSNVTINDKERSQTILPVRKSDDLPNTKSNLNDEYGARQQVSTMNTIKSDNLTVRIESLDNSSFDILDSIYESEEVPNQPVVEIKDSLKSMEQVSYPVKYYNTAGKSGIKLDVTPEIIRLLLIAYKNSSCRTEKKLKRVMNAMKLHDINPDLTFYNILLTTFITNSQWRKALITYNEMRSVHNILPNTTTFDIMLDCCRHAIDEPSMIFETLRLSNLPINFCYQCSVCNAGNILSKHVLVEAVQDITLTKELKENDERNRIRADTSQTRHADTPLGFHSESSSALSVHTTDFLLSDVDANNLNNNELRHGETVINFGTPVKSMDVSASSPFKSTTPSKSNRMNHQINIYGGDVNKGKITPDKSSSVRSIDFKSSVDEISSQMRKSLPKSSPSVRQNFASSSSFDKCISRSIAPIIRSASKISSSLDSLSKSYEDKVNLLNSELHRKSDSSSTILTKLSALSENSNEILMNSYNRSADSYRMTAYSSEVMLKGSSLENSMYDHSVASDGVDSDVDENIVLPRIKFSVQGKRKVISLGKSGIPGIDL